MSAPKYTTDAKPLKRGRACLTCRFLKIKCDGARPICGPCLSHPKDDECEYADSPRRSRAKQLEDQVAQLQARIKELETREQRAVSVALNQPYIPDSSSATTTLLPSTSAQQWASSPYSSGPSLAAGTPPSPFEPGIQRTDSSHSQSQFQPDEPPNALIRDFVDMFTRYAPELGFFLNIPRFIHGATLPHLAGDERRPCAAVLFAVYLWGSHLSEQHSPNYHRLHANTSHYRDLALRNAATGLLSSHPHRHLHTIQAEILLAYYFMWTGNFLEARRHSTTALSLAVGCGLHRIRSERLWPQPTLSTSSDDGTLLRLHVPADAVEEGERIDAFWHVVILCKTLSLAVVVDGPTEICGQLETPGFMIDTPWPLDQRHYQDGLLPPTSHSTVSGFLRQTVPPSPAASQLALTAQSSILLHHVVYVTGLWAIGQRLDTFQQTYQSLNQLIGTLRQCLPPLDLESHPSLFFTHALAMAAVIRLNETLTNTLDCRKECVVSATSLVRWAFALLKDAPCTNPMTGKMITIAMQALFDEAIRLKADVLPLDDSNEYSREGVDQSIQAGIHVLTCLARDSPLSKYELTTVQATYSAL
ncbi:hypothetical protein CYLTODRAFT_419979 [Cylindrobasidium torrendii FP15055 ss-10]|uniref:Zn(2)-C6 fungal-type domain-containing protein n=1 Tax=Cylindrobasidium torrendii FP15055 ss-10 TaxID=1314674 RepID=A0A0D7BJ63_9AGAR|nr:hypothetical protein CYLTODRAFT_419979 [Cylindrobasidium torrendii FP15055 ss-10]